MNQWSMNKSVPIQMRTGENAAPSETKVQFHSDQVMLLACHKTQITIYNASNMKPICQVHIYYRTFFVPMLEINSTFFLIRNLFMEDSTIFCVPNE
jgi:hypothetical protein